MKRLLVLATLLLSTFSAHATTVVAEDTAEHTINFTFGRPTADVWLCLIELIGSSLDTMTFDGITIDGDWTDGNSYRFFTRDSAPLSSTLHLNSANYGTLITIRFCHDLQVPSENPGGQIDTFYKISTPSTESYFTNAQVKAYVDAYCPEYNVFQNSPKFDLTSNAATDFTLISSTPFTAGTLITSQPADCSTSFYIEETASGPRPSSETSGNVTVGVQDQIIFN